MRLLDIQKEVGKITGQGRRATSKNFMAIFHVIREALDRGCSVGIPEFGRFSVIKRHNVIGYNFKTKNQVNVDTHNIVLFKPYPQLKVRINKGYHVYKSDNSRADLYLAAHYEPEDDDYDV